MQKFKQKEIAKCKKSGGGGTPSQPRNSNLEFFRILTMLLIVAHHYVVNSGLTAVGGPVYSDPLSWRSMFLLLFGAWGKTGINCFVLITGYFMCKSRISAKKFAKLLLEIEFYKIVFYVVFLLTGYESFSITGLAKAVLPVTGVTTGFISCYLLFYLCIPFLNILLQNLNQRQHIRLILLSCFIYVVLGTIPKITVTMNYVTWFIVLYFIASYIRLYPAEIFESAKIWGWLGLASLFVSAVSVVACTWLSVQIGRTGTGMFYFVSDSNKIFALTTAFCAFLFFLNLKPRYSRFVNAVGASTFGVLLIHANSDTMRRWLWQDTLNNVGMYGSPWLILHAVGSVIVIFAVASAIDCLRIRCLERPFFRFWDRHWEKASSKLSRTEQKLCKKFHIQEE